MDNRDTHAAWSYHDGTKHPAGHLMNPHHRYDPMRNPLPFKIYEGLDSIPLSPVTPPAYLPALSAIATDMAAAEGQAPDIGTIAKILHYSAGVTKTLRSPRGEMSFRAAACTGALYHIELYLVCGDLMGLEAGVYHFHPGESAIVQLRQGDYRRVLVDASGGEPGVADAPAILVYTDVFWRNAVKYQAREYRHAFWDSGTIIANTLAITAACGLTARVVAGFSDRPVNRLLGLRTRQEVAVALMPIGFAPGSTAGPSPDVGRLDLSTVAVSDYETDFPAIREMHEASSLATQDEVVAWREGSRADSVAAPSGTPIAIVPLAPVEVPPDPVETVIKRRGSTRKFSHESIAFPELSTILDRATRGVPSDFVPPQSSPLNDIYMIVNAVEGLPSGAYAYHRGLETLELVRQGEFRSEAGQLALNQPLGADASVNVYLMADLESILDRLGNRGYRAAQLEASITAGRFYIAAYSLRIGATGLTFFDDAVTEFFSPQARGKSAMFLVALGKRQRAGRA